MIYYVKNEIQEAIERIELNESQIRLLPEQEGLQIFNKILAYFVVNGDRRWWWEDFRFPATSVKFEDQKAFLRIDKIVPDVHEKIWFIAEDNQEQFYPVYEATADAVQKIIGECFGFEYYLVAKDMSWLLCETHHADLIGIGTAIESRLRELQN